MQITIPHLNLADLTSDSQHTYLGASLDGFIFSSSSTRLTLQRLVITWTKISISEAEDIVEALVLASKSSNRIALIDNKIFIPEQNFFEESWDGEVADITCRLQQVRA